MSVPRIEGIAPKLAVLAEVVGRHAGYLPGPPSRVEIEEPRLGPNVGGVLGRENGQVPDDEYLLRVGRLLERGPLLREEELEHFIALDGGPPLFEFGGEGGWIAHRERLGPVIIPEGAIAALSLGLGVVFILDSHEKGIGGEP
jgi:hypothetical protein